MKSWSGKSNESNIHAMTCDVEDYFQVSAFDDHVDKANWGNLDCRISRNVDSILQHFSEFGVKGTFFTLGWVAENYPGVIRKIVAEGHEIASHGMRHTRVWQQDSEQFLEDASSSKQLLEDVSGTAVTGYRAASWSMDGRTPWAHDVLAEAGYKYSSSIYPISHDHFGMPDSPTSPYLVEGSGILEIPASVAKFLGRNIPAAGGGYFRLYPLRFSIWLIKRIEKVENGPFVFYFHPWELDPDQPRISGISAQVRFRHYLNLPKFQARLRALLREFNWGRMDQIYLGEDSN